MRRALAFASLVVLAGCSKPESTTIPESRPSILLVTLDTTRADAIGPDTPEFNSLAARGRRFTRAYATAPQTLPSHASMMTGVYPAGHGIHENARYIGDEPALVAEKLQKAGYRTAAFISAYPLARQFGLSRGFETYDDELGGKTERSARATTDRALSGLAQMQPGPMFVWVHYFEPHHPYEPPEPFRSRFKSEPYRGEIAAMDHELGRLVRGLQQRFGTELAILIVGDHGEGLGEHGEWQHGNLLYEGTMRVPLVLAGPGITAGLSEAPVSIRRIFHTVLDWAGIDSQNSLREGQNELVLGEAMQPFLAYGWQPQIMAVEGNTKVINAGAIEVYDVVADPKEFRDVAAQTALSREVRQALRDYPIPSAADPPGTQELTEEDRRQLASLGYVTSEARTPVRPDAPRPRDMAQLFELLEKASGLSTRGQYAEVIPILERILAADPQNPGTLLRLAAAHSALGHDDAALDAFNRARALTPDSTDALHYLALHFIRTGEWQRAAPLLERVLAKTPNRLPALEALARVREKQGRFSEALALLQEIQSMRGLSAEELIRMGQMAMRNGETAAAIHAFERARQMQGASFLHTLELAVLYLAAGRYSDARDSLDRVPPNHPEYPMALFKRAQVSVLLGEPDQGARIESARRAADATTRALIERERLFAGK